MAPGRPSKWFTNLHSYAKDMSIAHALPINIKDLGAELARYRSSLPSSAKSGLRIRANDNRLSLTVAKNSGLRVVVDPHVASFEGKKLPRFSVEVQDFQTTTEASSDSTRLVFAPKALERGVSKRKGSSVRNEFTARVRRFFDTAVVRQLHEAALKDALNAPHRVRDDPARVGAPGGRGCCSRPGPLSNGAIARHRGQAPNPHR